MNSAYDEKLRKLLEEGKISSEQYEELKAHLPKEQNRRSEEVKSYPPVGQTGREGGISPSGDKPRHEAAVGLRRKIPWRVLACVIFLFVVAIMNIAEALFSGAVICVILAVGLFYAQKWAFIVTIALDVIHVAVNLAHLPQQFLALVLNVGFMVFLCASYQWFFPAQGKEAGEESRTSLP
jgi:hypothetical protein